MKLMLMRCDRSRLASPSASIPGRMGTPGAATAEVVDLQAIGLPRLVFALLRQRFSGLLSVQQPEPDAGERSVWFQGGMPIFTDWVSAGDSLGQILVETGQLTSEERDRATLALQSPGPEAVASTRERLGHYLVRRRLLNTAQLRKALRIQCARKLVHSFAVRSGEAHVTGGESSAPVDEHTLGAQVNALELIFAGVTTHYDLARGRRGDGPAVRGAAAGALVAGPLPAHFHFSAADEALLAAFEPSATIVEAAQRSGQSRLRAAQIAYTLWACQMLKRRLGDARGDDGRARRRGSPRRRPQGQHRRRQHGPGALAELHGGARAYRAGVRAGAHAFDLMGVPLSAGRAEVKAAWHGLSRRFHPDALAHQELGTPARALGGGVRQPQRGLSDLERHGKQREELSSLLRAGGVRTGRTRRRRRPRRSSRARCWRERATDRCAPGTLTRRSSATAKAALRNPDDVELQAAIAWCEYQRSSDKAGLREATEATLRGVLARQPRCARAHYYLGLLYVQARDDETALAAFTSALAVEPEMLDAKRQIHAIELRYSAPGEP
jgi:hypothetical protein